MKVYNLGCAQGHRFEGWFASEDDSSAQLQQKAIACPYCDSTDISKLPSAPRLNLSTAETHPDPATLQARLMTLLRKAVADADDVGGRFAEEARRMHYDEIPERPIRGTASAQDCAELADEGINVLPLPPSILPKTSLQ